MFPPTTRQRALRFQQSAPPLGSQPTDRTSCPYQTPTTPEDLIAGNWETRDIGLKVYNNWYSGPDLFCIRYSVIVVYHTQQGQCDTAFVVALERVTVLLHRPTLLSIVRRCGRV